MQLSVSTVPTETNRTALLAAGDTLQSVPDAAAREGKAVFGQLFPNLAPGSPPVSVLPGNDSIIPTTAATGEMIEAWSMLAGLDSSAGLSPGTDANVPLVVKMISGTVKDDNAVAAEPSGFAIDSATDSCDRIVPAGTHHPGSASLFDAGEPVRKLVSAAAPITQTLPVLEVVAMATPESSPALVDDSATGLTATHLSGKVLSPATRPKPVSKSTWVSVTSITAPAVGKPPAADVDTNALNVPVDAITPNMPVPSTEVAIVSLTTPTPVRPVLAGELTSRYLVATARPLLASASTEMAPGLSPAIAGLPPAVTAAPAVLPATESADLASPLGSPGLLTAGSTPALSGSAAILSEPAPDAKLAARNDRATSFNGHGANLAALGEKISAERTSVHGAPDKTFLSASQKRVTSSNGDLGIDVAKTSPAMPAATLFSRPASAVLVEHTPISGVATPSVDSPMPAAPMPPADASGAHRAVEAVLTAVDRFNSGDRHAVNLQFSVGGADLTVHVELRADEVRTLFRTDSPELRAALAHQWQSVDSAAADRLVRLASPVFSSADGSNLTAFSGDSGPGQRDSGARRPADERFQMAATSAQATRPLSPVLDEATLSASRLLSPATTQHLHALA